MTSHSSLSNNDFISVKKAWPLSVLLIMSMLGHIAAAGLVTLLMPRSLSVGTEFMAPAQNLSVLLAPTPPIKPKPIIEPKPTLIKKPKQVVKKKIITTGQSKTVVNKPPVKVKKAPVKKKIIKKIEKKQRPKQKEIAAQAPIKGPVKQQVSYAPVPSYRPEPKYPMLARRRGIEGAVVFEVFLANSGRVNQAIVLQSSGSSLLDKSAAKAIQTWRFPANRFNSLSSFKQRIVFTLNN